MIGNDIVDWAHASRESNWQRRGFLTKLFTSDEQQLIHSANHPEHMVWTLWSLKESVYKANLRQTEKRQFAPHKIRCQLQLEQEGQISGVAFYDYKYRIKASTTQHYVSSVAVLASKPFNIQEEIIVFKQANYYYQHTQLRQFINRQYTNNLIPASAVTVQKDDKNIPFLVIAPPNANAVQLPISLSHHGYYGAFVIYPQSLKPLNPLKGDFVCE